MMRKRSRYQTIAKLGQGTYGSVFHVKDKETGREYAMKQLNQQSGNSPGFNCVALREMRAMLTVHHPAIIQCHNIVIDEQCGSCSLILDLMPTDLSKYIMRRHRKDPVGQYFYLPLPENLLQYMMFQILSGLAALHTAWIMHRDMKPNNILVNCDSREVKICDFGFARQFYPHVTALSRHVAALQYRAPELLTGTADFAEYDAGMDVWGAGLILAELTIGSNPFLTGDSESRLLYIIFDAIQLPPPPSPFVGIVLPSVPSNPLLSRDGLKTLSPLGKDILLKLLEPDPRKRITSVAALRHPWFDGLEPKWRSRYDVGANSG